MHDLFKIISIVFVLFTNCTSTTTALLEPSQADDQAPWVGNFRFEPSTFAWGEKINLVFDYRNVRGGLSGATIYLDYEGSLPTHTRRASMWAQLIKKQGGPDENGTFRGRIRIGSTDQPPYNISYWLRIKDKDGRASNTAMAMVHYR